MTQPTYLLRAGGFDRGKDVVQTDDVTVRYQPKYRQKKITNIGGLDIAEVEKTGVDRSRLRVSSRNGYLTGSGRWTTRGAHAASPSTAAGLKTVLRRIRPQEAERLDALDTEIAETEARLAALRGDRQRLVQEAFTRGNVVRLGEVEVLS